MKYRVRHVTRYVYTNPVSICHNRLHVTPRHTEWQRTRDFRLVVTPRPAVLTTDRDYYGNEETFFTVQEAHTELEIRAESEVAVLPPLVPKAEETIKWDIAPSLLRSDLSATGLEAYEFALESTHVPYSAALRKYAEPSFPQGRPLLAAVQELNHRIHTEFKYSPLVTTISTPVEQVLEQKAGVCQDFAHLMLGCLRSLGLAARYVSGYLLTNPPPGKPRLIGADASHAWVSVFAPACGWVDFDPTNDMIAAEKHITLAWGRDYSDVSPVRGVILGGGNQKLSVSVDVAPVEDRETARLERET